MTMFSLHSFSLCLGEYQTHMLMNTDYITIIIIVVVIMFTFFIARFCNPFFPTRCQ